MPLSFKSRLSKLEHKGLINKEEYQDLIKKLDVHDKQIRADVIEKCIEIVSNADVDIYPSIDIILRDLEKLKEQNK